MGELCSLQLPGTQPPCILWPDPSQVLRALHRVLWSGRLGRREPEEGMCPLHLLCPGLTHMTSAHSPLVRTHHMAPPRCQGVVTGTMCICKWLAKALPIYSQIFRIQRVTVLESFANTIIVIWYLFSFTYSIELESFHILPHALPRLFSLPLWVSLSSQKPWRDTFRRRNSHLLHNSCACYPGTQCLPYLWCWLIFHGTEQSCSWRHGCFKVPDFNNEGWLLTLVKCY